jgi:hypothetical protein
MDEAPLAKKEPNMDHIKFLREFYPKADRVTDAEVAGRGRMTKNERWTAAIGDVLKEIGESNGFEVRCKGHGAGEFERMDFAFFERGRIGDSPTAIIEHENHSLLSKILEDFKKLCTWRVPLQVMIGYGKKEGIAKQRAQDVMSYYDQMGLKQLPNGETLIVIGWRGQNLSKRQAPGWRHWWCWLRKGESPWVLLDRTRVMNFADALEEGT